VGLCVIQSVWLLSILIIILQAVNTRDGSFSLSLSLDKLSGVAPHHQACPRCLSVAHCFSSTSTSSHSTCLTFVINQTIIVLERDSMQHVSLSLLNEGIVVSQRERERERERMLLLFFLFSCIQRVCACYDTANSLSIVTLPTKHTMCVCV